MSGHLTSRSFRPEHVEAVREAAKNIREGVALSKTFPPGDPKQAAALALAVAPMQRTCDLLDEVAVIIGRDVL